MQNYLKIFLKDFVKFASKALFVFILLITTVFVSIYFLSKAEENSDKPTYAIEGIATREVKPDRAIVKIGTQIEGENVVEIQNMANKAINEAVEDIKELGIEEENIRTSNYSVNPVYDWERRGLEQYSTDISLTITIENIIDNPNLIGQVVEVAANAELNEIRSTGYEITNREEIIEDLRIEAVNKAKDKKERLSEETGFDLGDIKSISYNGANSVQPMYGRGYEDLALESESYSIEEDINIYTGEDEIKVIAQVRFEIK